MPHRVKLTIEIDAMSEADVMRQYTLIGLRLGEQGGLRSIFGMGTKNGSSRYDVTFDRQDGPLIGPDHSLEDAAEQLGYKLVQDDGVVRLFGPRGMLLASDRRDTWRLLRRHHPRAFETDSSGKPVEAARP